MFQTCVTDFRKSAAVIVFISFIALSAALMSQYVFGLNPCVLCIYQRIPYVFAIAFGLIAYGAARQCKNTTRFFIFLAVFVLFVDSTIAVFHVGVEQKWWEGLSECSVSSGAEMTLEELRQAVLSAPVVRCDEVAWSLFGISMAGYNALLSFALGVFGSISFFKGHKYGENASR